MAIANTLFDNGGGALATLLSQGVAALNGAINNAISVGRDRATGQMNQEKTLFDVMKNEKNNQFRKAENLRRGFETDRLFKRMTERDAETDKDDVRDFERKSQVEDRNYMENASQFNRSQALSEKNSADMAASRTTAEQQRGQQLELDAQKTGAELLRLQEEQRRSQVMFDRREETNREAAGNTIADALTSPQAAQTLPDEDLQNYVDVFGGRVSTPQAEAAVRTAAGELRRRNPDVDPMTGKRLSKQYAPDKNNPYLNEDGERVAPEVAVTITENLKSELQDLTDMIEIAKEKKPSLLPKLTEQRAKLVEKLSKGGEAASAPKAAAPGDKTPDSYFK